MMTNLTPEQMAEAVSYAKVFIEMAKVGEKSGWIAPPEQLEMVQALLQSRQEVELCEDYWREFGAMLALHPDTPIPDIGSMSRVVMKIGIFKGLPEIQREFSKMRKDKESK